MRISYPRSMPIVPVRSSRFGLSRQQATFEGFNRGVSIQAHAGGLNDRHEGVLTTPHLSEANHKIMLGWLLSLRGREKTFKAVDPNRKTSSQFTASTQTFDKSGTKLDSDIVKWDVDSLPGIGRVNGEMGGRRLLVSDNWKVSTSLFSIGDAISIAGHLYTVLEDVTSDGSGNATFEVEPPLKSASDNTTIFTHNPHMIARLASGSPFWESGPLKSGPISFAFEEVL